MKTKILPCSCGAYPELCYHDHITSFNGTHGASVYETTRFYRYICPYCHEWGKTSEFPFVAKRFWNQLRKGKYKSYWHNADMEKGSVWRTMDGTVLIGSLPSEQFPASWY